MYLKTRVLLLTFLGTLIASVPSSAANNATKELCHPHDKRALLRIKQQLLNTSVKYIHAWDPATDCCYWWWVVCGSNNRVNFLLLEGKDSEGPPLPSAISELPYLDTLAAHDNFVGPIPATLAKLRRLTILDLSFNRFSGPVPSFLGTLPKLFYLLLSNNLLTGAIPPGLAQLAPLTVLEIKNNKLTGTIPESVGNFNAEMEISLANNMLSGEIPRSLDKDMFISLDLSGNRLKGDPSFLFSKDKARMTSLYLSHNSFSFDMTNLSVTSSLVELNLSHNKIHGSLPEALAHLQRLDVFNVSYNRLCGRIPTGALQKFDKTSYLHNKCLCGHPLPPCK